MFSKNRKYSPVKQDFIWLAEYADGNHYSEFDFHTKQENNFYNINRSSLIRFGLIGHGMELYYEVLGGIFKLNGQMVEIIYKVDDKEYYLTGQQKMYNDIISYKDAESIFTLNPNEAARTNITQFNFGYKVDIEIEGIKFNFKPICKIPSNEPIYINFRLVSSESLDGILIIKKNGFITKEFKAPLEKNIGGELNWIFN